MQATEDLMRLKCGACCESLGKDRFSGTQWKRGYRHGSTAWRRRPVLALCREDMRQEPVGGERELAELSAELHGARPGPGLI